MLGKIKICLIENSIEMRNSIRFLSEKILGYEIVEEASNGKEFIEKYEGNADLILMDIDMDAFETAELLLRRYPETKILGITDYEDQFYLDALIRSGFHGYVLKRDLFNSLRIGVTQIISNKIYFLG